MVVYDTLTEKKKRLIRPKKGAFRMFVCGPTVYNYSHIGHARTYIVFDVVARWLRHRGFNVFYLQNITDIDDKIKSLAEARRFEKEYFQDMEALNITSVDKYARASAHLSEIKRQIKQLLDKGYAYLTDSGIYFEVKKFPRYGALSKQNLEALRPGWRIEPDPQKKDPLDFALWKFENKWNFPSPWGKGRPGWHIEDTAITEKYFGPQYDLHGAAVDLKFPHHDSEIAQQEAISGKRPMVKIWMHAGFLLVNGEKMSKSLGNFITIKDFIKKYPPDVLRLLILSHHYRSPVNYTNRLAQEHLSSWHNLEKFMRTIQVGKRQVNLAKIKKEFQRAMDDDFNTPKALAVLFKFAAQAPKTDQAKQFLSSQFKILGIELTIPKISVKIEKLLLEREKYRQRKEFKQADRIREQIQKSGFYVED